MLTSIKRSIKPFLGDAYRRLCRARFAPRCVAVICPPIPAENLGDQAMVLGAVSELRRRGEMTPILIKSGPNFDFDGNEFAGFEISERSAFFGSTQTFREECGLIRDFSRSRQLLVFGADILDGHYGETRYRRTFDAIRRAVELGTRVRIIGFSISDTPNPEALRFFQQYSERIELFPRDPVSLRRLRDTGAKNLTLAADVAFLMDAADETELPETVRGFFSRYDGNVIGVSLHYNFFHDAPESRFDYMVEVLDAVQEQLGAGMVFVPHHPADIEYFKKIEYRAESRMREQSLFVPELPSAPIAKRMFANCRHVITSRMHVAIASQSSEVPVTCFPYFGKFEGLFEHFGLIDGLMYPESFPRNSSSLAESLIERVHREAEIREQIRSRLTEIKDLSRLNFAT